MRTTLSLTIVLMGLLGVALALTTGEIYRHLALTNQREALAELIAANVNERLRQMDSDAGELGLALQNNPAFRHALASGNGENLAAQLDKPLHPPAPGTDVTGPRGLLLFDGDFKLIGSSTGGDAGLDTHGCPGLIELAARRRGTERRQPLSTACLSSAGLPRYAVLVPIAAPPRDGYLQVITDPIAPLRALESNLGIPLKLTAPGGPSLYRSPAWPPPDAMGDTLVASYQIKNSSNEPVLTTSVMRDVKTLQDNLRQTRYRVIGIAVLVTLLGVALALITLQITALRPLNALTQQLHRVRKDKAHLGEPVEAGGIAEIRELAKDFNRMSAELHLLYHTLEHMAFTDPLTHLPNRVRFHDSLEEFTRFNSHTNRPFALLLMDLDRFKAVNDTLGHQVGDRLLMEVSARLRSVLRESDVITRLDGEAISQLENKMVARLGGDEFAAVLPSIKSTGDAALVARKLLLAMEEPFIIEGHRLNVGISIGIAMHPDHGSDTDTLMRRADAAMYEAKNKQLGFVIHDPSQNLDQTSLV
jgi:GGDEF domain-containing protein